MSVLAIARSRSTDKRYYGVAEAIVTSVNDPKKEGRVRLKFPMFNNKLESEWCRVRQSYAGNGYGSFFLPEVGDEVLVAFIHGDLRLPIILGGLYNGKDKPPSFRSGSKDEKMIRTKGKHEILMDDTQGKERVRIKTKSGHTADLSDQDKKVTIKSAKGQSVTIDDQGSKITIESSGTSVTINGSGTIQIKGTTVVVSASTIKLGGDSATEPLVKGQSMMLVYNVHTHNCTAPGSPSGPPLSPMTPAVLSQISKTS